MAKTIVVSGASSGFGATTVRLLADAGHTVYAGTRATADRNRKAVEDLERYSHAHGVRLFAIEMDQRPGLGRCRDRDHHGGLRSPGCSGPQRRPHGRRAN